MRLNSRWPGGRRTAAALLLGALWSTPLGAQVTSLSREQAVQRALQSSTELARARDASSLATQLGRSAVYPNNPVLSLELEGAPSPWSGREYTRRLSLEQELDLHGARGARLDVGRGTSAVIERDLSARRHAVVAAVDEAVGRWLVARHRLDLLGPLLDRATSVRASAEVARRRESLSPFSARMLGVDAVELGSERADAQRALDEADAQLRAWLAPPPGDSLQFDDDLDGASWSCPVDSVTPLLGRTRPDLARAAAEESLASARLELERRLARVNPTLGVSLGREQTFFDQAAGASAGLTGSLHDANTLVGVRASIPLPLSQRNQLGIAEASVDLGRARADRASLELAARQDLLAACAALQRAEERRALLREPAQIAEQDLRLVESAFRDGRVGLEEYLTDRERLVRIQREAVDALAAVEEARARLVRSTGMTRTQLSDVLGGSGSRR